jgi:hypothetical protein
MRHRVSIEIDPAAVGQAFANTDDEAQAAMISEMALELKALCGNKYEDQICALSKLLTNHGKHLVREIVAFIDLREAED